MHGRPNGRPQIHLCYREGVLRKLRDHRGGFTPHWWPRFVTSSLEGLSDGF
jgi:hypothetical protein